MTTEPKNTELMSCPFCGQQDAFVEQLDRDASVVICQGRVDQHSACLARGPVGLREHEVEDQPGRNAAVREWNRRAQTADQQGQPVAWMHVMHQEFDQKLKQLSLSPSSIEVFGKPNVDYDPSYRVTCEPLYLRAQPATAKVPLPADWRSLADQLQAVGLAYWDAHHRERGSGAVKWLHNEETGALFVITRGEYASQVKDFVCSLDGVPTDQHGQPVAHCVERRNGSGEWINDAKSWVDGAPGREIVEYCAKYPELMRVRMAYAQPVTVRVDEALVIELPGRLSFCRVSDSPIDDKTGDLLDYDDTVAAIEAAGIKVKP